MDEHNRVSINEITLRDGIQNIEGFIPTEDKNRLLEMIVDAGATNIECTAFVHPKWVPQLSDAQLVFDSAGRFSQLNRSALIPNLRGYERAVGCGVKEIVAVLSASEIHNKANLNMSVDESLDELKRIGDRAVQDEVAARANIATAFGYKTEEVITPEQILHIAETLLASGFTGATLCDTTGVASPDQVFNLTSQILDMLGPESVAVHFHQCDGIEFANVYAAWNAGIRIFESAAGGLGGCPFAHEADGNIPTEKLVKMFCSMGIECGIDQGKIDAAALFARDLQLRHATSVPANPDDTESSNLN